MPVLRPGADRGAGGQRIDDLMQNPGGSGGRPYLGTVAGEKLRIRSTIEWMCDGAMGALKNAFPSLIVPVEFP